MNKKITKKIALKIAKNLVDAVCQGLITEDRAKREFRKVVYEYKRQQNYIALQKENALLWQKLGELMRA